MITDEYGNFIPALEIYKYGIVNSSGDMEGFIPEILVSPKYSITKEDLKPKLYSGNIANHPDANNSMTDWFKVISYLTPNNKQRFLNWLNKHSLAITGATIGGAAAITDNKKIDK